MIRMRGNVGIVTKMADILSVDGKDRSAAPVEFAADAVEITLRNEELTELRELLRKFEPAT